MISSQLSERTAKAQAKAAAEKATHTAEKAPQKADLLPMTGTFPETEENCISRFSFHYLGKLISLGNKRPLTPDDLWELPDREKVEHLLAEFRRCQEPFLTDSGSSGDSNTNGGGGYGGSSDDVEPAPASATTTRSGKFPLGKPLWVQFRCEILTAAFFMLLQVGCQIGGPLIIRQIVLAVTTRDPLDPYRGLYLAFIYFGVQLLTAVCAQQHLHWSQRTGASAASRRQCLSTVCCVSPACVLAVEVRL